MGLWEEGSTTTRRGARIKQTKNKQKTTSKQKEKWKLFVNQSVTIKILYSELLHTHRLYVCLHHVLDLSSNMKSKFILSHFTSSWGSQIIYTHSVSAKYNTLTFASLNITFCFFILNTKSFHSKQNVASGLRDWLRKHITRLLLKLCLAQHLCERP